MTDADLIADLILAARRAQRQLDSLGPAAPEDAAAGYAAQFALALKMDAVPPAGFKIGATAKVMQDYLGLTGPAAGFVARDGLLETGGSARFTDFRKPGVECEVALRLGADLPPGPCSRDQAGAAVAEVFAGIEIVEGRYGDLVALGTPTLIADQVFHAGGVLGIPAPGWPAIDLAAARGEIFVDGVSRGSGVGADLLGHPLAALAWLADSGAAHAFGGLKARQVVFLGSVTPPIWLDGPCEVVVQFDLLGTTRLRFT